MPKTSIPHPLEPLTAGEIETATRVLRQAQSLPPRHRFVEISLWEPAKADLLANDGRGLDRAVFIVLLDRAVGTTYEGVVSVSEETVRSWRRVPGVQPAITLEEFDECEAICKADPGWQAAVRRRGITDFGPVLVEPEAAGAYDGWDERRLVRALTWAPTALDDNPYAHPVENLFTWVDLNQMAVVRIEDAGVVPVPRTPFRLQPPADASPRPALRPLDIRQTEGASFTIDHYEVRWQRWRFRIGFTPREGLVLHTIGYEDGNRVRSILYRASLAEMVIPYGDPRPTHSHKNAFDAGEYNMGAMANSLELGCDCLGEIRYLDAVLGNGSGEPRTIRNAICLHEEDDGVLWKHRDSRTGCGEVRRSRRLVVSWFATVGNYDYGFFWYFYQDGSLALEVKLTGIVSTGALPPATPPTHGQLLTPEGLYGPVHCHFFNFRLDLDVDGPHNAVEEVELVADPPGPANPLDGAFHASVTRLRRESEAQRDIDPLHGRFWRVINPGVTNRLGQPVGYRLLPRTSVLSVAASSASVSQRAGFARHHLWVTPYAPDERYAAGDYPNQHPGGAGLPAWTAANRNLDDTDLVLWYTLGCPHIVRSEDWPVMPVERAGFALQPDGFFDVNPALDVAPPDGHDAECGIR